MRDANLVLKASGAETTSKTNATGVDFGSGDGRVMGYVLVATAVTGTGPTLDAKIQESDNNSTWRDLCAFKQVTAAGVERVSAQSNARYRRYYSTIAGTTPSFTYSIYPELGGQYDEF